MNRPNRPMALALDTDHIAHVLGGAQIRVACGALWLTIDGEPDDWVLERGQSVTLPPGAHGLVQALHAPARAVVLRPDSWRDRLAQAWHAFSHRRAEVLV